MIPLRSSQKARPDIDPGLERAPWPTRYYLRGLLVAFALLPIWGIVFHGMEHVRLSQWLHGPRAPGLFACAELLAAINGLFMTIVTAKAYRERCEPFLKWLMLGFLSFSLLYAPQGLLGIWAGGIGITMIGGIRFDVGFFLLYGPVARLSIVLCLFIGLWRFGVAGQPLVPGMLRRFAWQCCAAVLVCIAVICCIAALRLDVGLLRRTIDGIVLVVSLAGLVPIVVRRLHAALIMLYTVSLVWLAQASIAFMISHSWDDLWWYGHLVQGGGMLILSYGAINAFNALRVYDGVYNQDEILWHLRAEKRKAEDALAQLQLANEELSRLATTDALTGVSNRRQFMQELAAEIARSRRTDAPLTLLMLDLDRFKSINDTYGHPAGDQVLKDFARLLQASVRLPDHVGRLGGEEFGVVLPDTGYAVAYGVAERLRENCATLTVSHQGRDIHFTISIGVGYFGRDGESAEQLISAADRRLYLAKEAGRNRVEA